MKYYSGQRNKGRNLRPPDLYEYSIDNYWFETGDLMAGDSNEFTTHFIVNKKMPYAGPTRLRGPFSRGVKWMMQTFDYSPIH